MRHCKYALVCDVQLLSRVFGGITMDVDFVYCPLLRNLQYRPEVLAKQQLNGSLVDVPHI